MRFTDQLHRKISLTKTPYRIISLVPSQTELLVDLGLEEKIVGVTKFCVHPSPLRKQKTVVGGTKQVHFDKIRQLKPDIIICNKEENTQEMVAALEAIAPVWVSDVKDVEDALQMIQCFGGLFKVENRAKKLIATINSEKDAFVDAIYNTPELNVAYLIWKDPYMATGSDTFINSLLTLNKFQNIFNKSNNRYPEVTLEQLQAADLILLSSEPYPFQQKHIDELSQTLRNKKILLVDGEYFSWYGSRLIKAFEYFKSLQKTIH